MLGQVTSGILRPTFPMLTALALAALMAFAGSAHATDDWSNPYPGVRRLHRRGRSQNIYALVVNLSAPEVSLVSTRPEDRYIRVSEFGRRTESVIAINANYYGAGSCGLAAGDGEVWGDSYSDGCDMSLGFGRLNEALAFDSFDLARGPLPESWMTEVVTGKPWLVRDGVLQGGWIRPRHIHGRHPRTAVGLTRDRRTLIIVVADGRRRGIAGLTGYELADLMLELDAWDAVNLDGGGSSELWMRPISRSGSRQRYVVNDPSDGRERIVVNHLGVRIRPGANWYSARLAEISPAPVIGPNGRATAWARFVNTGRMPWSSEALSARILPVDDAGAALQSLRVHADATTDVPSGGAATFRFSSTAPGSLGSYLASFAPMLDDTVLADPASWVVRVIDDPVPPTAAVDEPTTTPGS